MDTAEVDLVIGNSVENRPHHHLGHQASEMRSDTTMRSEPECDVAVGRTVQHDLVGSLEFLFVVIGGQPADDDPVVAPKVLPAKDDVASHSAAQLLVDREVAQKFICRCAVQLGVLDELSPQLWMGTQVQQGQRGL